MGTNFLAQWIASLFATFKAKNPLIAAIVLLVLSVAVHTVHQGEVFGLFPVSGAIQTVLEYVTLFLTAVTGSQTYQYMEQTQKKK